MPTNPFEPPKNKRLLPSRYPDPMRELYFWALLAAVLIAGSLFSCRGGVYE
jgi:hypothetical protein